MDNSCLTGLGASDPPDVIWPAPSEWERKTKRSTMTEQLDQWRAKWQDVGRDEHDRPWRLGALFNEGRKFVDVDINDEKAVCRAVEKLIPLVGVQVKQVREFAYVESAFGCDVRNARLSFSHHREIWAAGVVGPAQQRKWLSLAEKENLSRRDLRVRLAESKGGGERKEKAPKYDTSFILVQWADRGAAGINAMFPSQPSPEMLAAAKRECAVLLDVMRRVGIV